MTLFGYDQGVFGIHFTSRQHFETLLNLSHVGGVIVTPDFLDTLNLAGPEHTSLLGTVTALYDVGCFFGAVYVLPTNISITFLSGHVGLGALEIYQ